MTTTDATTNIEQDLRSASWLASTRSHQAAELPCFNTAGRGCRPDPHRPSEQARRSFSGHGLRPSRPYRRSGQRRCVGDISAGDHRRPVFSQFDIDGAGRRPYQPSAPLSQPHRLANNVDAHPSNADTYIRAGPSAPQKQWRRPGSPPSGDTFDHSPTVNTPVLTLAIANRQGGGATLTVALASPATLSRPALTADSSRRHELEGRTTGSLRVCKQSEGPRISAPGVSAVRHLFRRGQPPRAPTGERWRGAIGGSNNCFWASVDAHTLRRHRPTPRPDGNAPANITGTSATSR